MASVFISYASPDRVFAVRLASGIEQLGHTVWIDVLEVGIGDSLVAGIGAGLAHAAYLIVVLSPHTMQSAWMTHEWEVKYTEEIIQRRTVVLPALIADCPLPPLFRHKRFADFRSGYEIGFAQLAITLHTHGPASRGLTDDRISPDNDQVPPACTPHDNGNLACYTADMVRLPSKFSEINVELGVPYIGKISGLWKPDADEQFAAWELYIELVTRVPVAELHDDEGSLREALTSLYTIFTLTRAILHKYGPAIARPKQGGEVSFGFLAITILNHAIRPILAKWHPILLAYEHTKDPAVSASEHERRWNQSAELRQVLHQTRDILVNYTDLLAQVAGIPPLYHADPHVSIT
jgi:hypothetical protein